MFALPFSFKGFCLLTACKFARSRIPTLTSTRSLRFSHTNTQVALNTWSQLRATAHTPSTVIDIHASEMLDACEEGERKGSTVMGGEGAGTRSSGAGDGSDGSHSHQGEVGFGFTTRARCAKERCCHPKESEKDDEIFLCQRAICVGVGNGVIPQTVHSIAKSRGLAV